MKDLNLENFREVISLYNTAVVTNDLSDEILLESSLRNDLGLGSLEVIDMIAELEIRFDVIIDNLAFDQKMYPSISEATVNKFLAVCNECRKR